MIVQVASHAFSNCTSVDDDILATDILGTMCYKDVSAGHGPVRVTESSDENLRDRGTYIICFKDHVTEEELQQYVTALSKGSFEDK